MFVLCLVAPGCYASHERAEDATPDAGFMVDASPRDAESDAGECVVGQKIVFVPTARAQIAVWIESPGTYGRVMRTLLLTEAVARYGIGNRPGALQMNSGYRWPYGRREGVLPVWAHRRSMFGGAPFRRVIARSGHEGWADSEPPAGTRDDYFCLSSDAARSRRDGLDAASCASRFFGDKGRYITADDVAEGYAEPAEDPPGLGIMRPLGLESLYPPRRDLVDFSEGDHPDTRRYAHDALAAMPELDAITTATLPAGERFELYVTRPPGWPSRYANVFVEISVEGDYAPDWSDVSRPTPGLPEDQWDTSSQTYGYPYRGQPSVIFGPHDIDFEPPPEAFCMPWPVCEVYSGYTCTVEATGAGDLDGRDGDVHPLLGIVGVTDDSGSGASRLLQGRHRVCGSVASQAVRCVRAGASE